MYFIYSLLLGLAFLILLPRFLFDALRHGKYASGFRQRLGDVPNLADNTRPIIWVHCVSVGETQAARPLIKGLKEKFPFHDIVISTITRTGQELAQSILAKDAAAIFYFPFDWGWTVRRALNRVRPSTVLIMETELWPGFLRVCTGRRIPVAIVNGRLSERSCRRYRLVRSFMKRVFSSISLAVMQTEADAERLESLGMDPRRIRISGNLKFDAGMMNRNAAVTDEINQRFRFERETTLLAASTHTPEEAIVLEAFARLATYQPQLRLILAPRHPERFGEVAKLLEASCLTWIRRTSSASTNDAQAQVLLLDTIGELASVYSLAAVVVVGGSIAKTGGHNILEPAAAGSAVVTGAHTFNFRAIMKTFVEAGAVVQLPPLPLKEASTPLAEAIEQLFKDSSRREELVHRARALIDENKGATGRTLSLLDEVISKAPSSFDRLNALSVQGAPSA